MTRTDDIARRLDRATADLRHALAELADLGRYAPGEVAALVASLAAYLRSRDPRGAL